MSKHVTRRRFIGVSAGAVGIVACGGMTDRMEGAGSMRSAIDPRQAAKTASGVTAVVKRGQEPISGYVAVAPRTLRTGAMEQISFSLFRGDNLAGDTVNVALLKDGQSIASATGDINGRGSLGLAIPALPEGEYNLAVSGPGFKDSAKIRVEPGLLVFVETDKPIYKPGQTMKIRVVTLDLDLRPSTDETTVEVMDAKGTKVFKKVVQADEYGMATLDLPLSTEPNLGTWKIKATSGKRSGQIDVKVEKYTLPKYEIKVDLEKEWALVTEPIRGVIGAEYSFGKPVVGEVEIVAQRYVGAWQEYAKLTLPINGRTQFEVPAVGYAAGSPAGGGNAQVQLQVVVKEPATGYEEKSNRLVTVSASGVNLRVVPESQVFKPGLPLSLLVVAETPDKKAAEARVELEIAYTGPNFQQLKADKQTVTVLNGAAVAVVLPPREAITMRLGATAKDASQTSLQMQSGYSPSGSFIHLEQITRGQLNVGGTASFKVHSTKETANYYYEVLGRGKVLFSDYSRGSEIDVPISPQMAPEAKLLVYQLLPNSEVAADFLPFKVAGSYPHKVDISFDREEVRPGDPLGVTVQAEGQAKIGLVAVDRSVFILAENRLNLQQVFDELERLYLKPQAELHDVQPVGGGPVPLPPGRPVAAINVAPAAGAAPQVIGNPFFNPGAKDTFANAGVVVITNRQAPEGKSLTPPMPARAFAVNAAGAAVPAAPAAQSAVADTSKTAENVQGGLAEVQRVRQFFPETWFWESLTTDDSGRVSKSFEAPDSITTWMCRAVAISKDKGFGVSEAQVRVFQPFFVSVDLPYSSIRGEVFPAKIALYNYTDQPQSFQVDLEAADWFELLDSPTKTVEVAPNGLGGVAFTIRPKTLGVRTLKVTARSRAEADAIIKEMIVEPEGVQREVVENLALSAGAGKAIKFPVPGNVVPGSARAFLAVTGNVLSQTMEGLEKLLQMPFGCGEQNMILFAPNVFITKYLQETNQLKVEVLAKAEKLMITGYQRQLTYKRNDNSFSAFGNSDKEGSLWLSAFVLKTFAQAKDIMFIDDAVLQTTGQWITSKQNADGSFDPFGFVIHKEMLGGLTGKPALTAYIAIALREAGLTDAAANAIRYLERQVDASEDPYSLAIMGYSLAHAKSAQAARAVDKLLKLAQVSDEGLFWTGGPPVGQRPPGPSAPIMPPTRSAAIETSAYGALALLETGDKIAAGRVIRWLASQRNAYGGYGSTQDTVVALQAMASAAASSRADIDATIDLQAAGLQKTVTIDPANSDVLQIIELPTDGDLKIDVKGRGQVQAQVVTRFNLPAVERGAPAFQVDVTYNTDQVQVNDTITITAKVKFAPPMPVAAGMVVLDVAVPTGFAPVTESIEALAKQTPKLKRWDTAGRKVILYIEDMQPGDQMELKFQAKALYPVKAQAVASQAYAYYKPEWQGEHLGVPVTVA